MIWGCLLYDPPIRFGTTQRRAFITAERDGNFTRAKADNTKPHESIRFSDPNDQTHLARPLDQTRPPATPSRSLNLDLAHHLGRIDQRRAITTAVWPRSWPGYAELLRWEA